MQTPKSHIKRTTTHIWERETFTETNQPMVIYSLLYILMDGNENQTKYFSGGRK